MAEGFARAQGLDAFSAGVKTQQVNPFAIQVMAEAGVDISDQHSKLVSDLPDRNFDYVITLCDHAAGTCPAFPGQAVIVHHPFDDPPKLAQDMHSDGQDHTQAVLGIYRRVRDEIREYVGTLPDGLPPQTKDSAIPPPVFTL